MGKINGFSSSTFFNIACATLLGAFTACTPTPQAGDTSDGQVTADSTDAKDADSKPPHDSAPDAGDGLQGDGDASKDTVTGGPGLGIDYASSEPGVSPRFEPDAFDWTGSGWPNDRFRDDEGQL